MSDTAFGMGKSFAALGNEVSDAIARAIERGMEIDEAACVVVQVAADYARGEYGAAYLDQLAQVLVGRGEMATPPTRKL